MKDKIKHRYESMTVKRWRISFFLMLIFASTPLLAQNSVLITGEVISASDREPLIGVNILEKGTTNGVISDIDGKFRMRVAPDAVLVVSYIGFTPQEIRVTQGKSNYHIILQDDSQLIDEVVVVGYGVQKKKLVTGATVQVKGDDIARRNTISPLSALQSQTPGVNITKTSGQPGEGFKVIIRGIGTLGNSSPLYIVDGVARGNIDYLNPADIESLDVLKDAASAAIYGARAANGVVLVTTKKGSVGKASIEYDGYYGVQNVYKQPETLNAQDYVMLFSEGRANDGMDVYNFDSELAPGDWQRIQNGTWKGTNWTKMMENKNAPIQNHSINITGGTEQGVYSLGFSYTSQEGIYGKPVQSEYERYTVRLNSEYTLLKGKKFDVIKVGENVSYSYSEKNGIAIGNNYYNDLSNALRMAPVVPMWARDENGNDIVGEYMKSIPYIASSSNPIGQMEYAHGNNMSKNHSLNSNFYVEIQPIKDLRYRSNFGFNLSGSSYRSFTPVFDLGSEKVTENSVSQSMGLGFGWTFENTLSYDFQLKEAHSFNALIGMSAERSGLGENLSGGNKNSIFSDFKHAYLNNTPVIDPGKTTLGGSPWEKASLLSYFGRINYNYKEKYMATVVMRADGSYKFAKGSRWGYFPSISAGWVITNEKFMQPVLPVMDFFKLRASWGQNGNQSIASFQYLATIGYTRADYYFGPDQKVKTIGAYPDILANPDVKWETSEQTNIGFDARFFDSRLSLAFDWYYKKTKDWLVQAPMLASYGTGAPYINGGDIENKGIEVALGWRDNIGEFTYGATVNLAKNDNKVLKIANSQGVIESPLTLFANTLPFGRAEVGRPVGYFYGYKTDGIFQNEAEVQNYKNSQGKVILPDAKPGDVRFVDRNDDGYINDEDKTMIGSSHPDFNLGVNLNFEYKGFDLSMAMYGVFGNDIIKSYRAMDSPKQNYTKEFLGRWHGEGTSNKLPRMSGGAHMNWLYISDLYVQDGSYWRMNNITLGYDFKRIFKSLPFRQLRLYVAVQNLFTITNYNGFDPELGTSTAESWLNGVDFGFYPSPRTTMIGASIKF